MMSEPETASDRLETHCTEEETKLREALKRVMPIRVHDGQDYAEVFFADGTSHSTQAMTMNPDDWREIQSAWEAFSTSSSLPIAPDHVLVPRTELAKLVDALGGLCDSETPMNIVQVYEEWSAHLTAAPQPPSPEQGEEDLVFRITYELARLPIPNVHPVSGHDEELDKLIEHARRYRVRNLPHRPASAPPSSGEAEAVARALKVLESYGKHRPGCNVAQAVPGYGALLKPEGIGKPWWLDGQEIVARHCPMGLSERKADFVIRWTWPYRLRADHPIYGTIAALALPSSGEAEAVARAIEQAAQIAEQIENDATCPVVSIAQTIRTLSPPNPKEPIREHPFRTQLKLVLNWIDLY